jgi:MFS family permease
VLTFLRNNLRWIAGGFTLTFFSSFGQTYFISASITEWRTAFDLSHGEFGRLYMFATLASAACLPFLGRLIDSIPAHRMIAVVIPVLSAAAVMAGLAASITSLVVAIFLLRLFGQGMMTHIALTTTGRWFSAERGRAVSLVVLGHQGGEATLPLAFSAIAIGYGYQSGWYAGAAALLLLGLPFSFWAFRRPREPKSPEYDLASSRLNVRSWTRAEVVRDPVFWVLLIGVLAPGFIGTTIFYHQNYLTELNGWPPQLFAQSLVVLSLVTVVFALITGAVVDRFGAGAILPYFLIPLTISCFLLAESGSPSSVFVVMIFMGISYGITSTLFGSLWPEVYGTSYLGSIRALTVSAVVFATAAGPGLTGTLIDQGITLPTQMIYLGSYCMLATLAMAVASVYLKRRAAVPDSVELPQ